MENYDDLTNNLMKTDNPVMNAIATVFPNDYDVVAGLDLIDSVVAAGGDVNQVCEETTMRPLHTAVFATGASDKGAEIGPDVIERLLELGADKTLTADHVHGADSCRGGENVTPFDLISNNHPLTGSETQEALDPYV